MGEHRGAVAQGALAFLCAPRPHRALERGVGMKLVSEHRVVFRCGCDANRIARVLGSIYRENPEEIFLGDPTLEAECPRCGAKYQISREDLGPSTGG